MAWSGRTRSDRGGRGLRRLGGVAHDDVAEHLVDPRHQLGRDDDAGRLDVLGHLLRPGRADQCRRDVPVLQHPGDGELRHRQAELVGDRTQPLDAGEHGLALGEPTDGAGAALLVGRPGAGRRRGVRQVLAGEHALGDRRPDDLRQAELLARRDDLLLDDPPEHRVLRLRRDELRPAVLALQVEGALDLPRAPLAEAEVARLPLPDDLVQRLQGLLERRRLVVAMALVEIDQSMLIRSLNEGFSGGEKKRNEIFQMAMLEPKLAILDETDSGLDIDAIRIVANGVNKLRTPENSVLVITHYQRLLDYIVPDFVHVLYNGRIVKSGTKELAYELEEKGYDFIKSEVA